MKITLPHSTARDVFGHLLGIGTLYACVIGFITLLFQYVNVKFPDVLSYSYSNALDIIRNSMAVLIVVWPAFILISWLLSKDVQADPKKHQIGIKKWLLYLTLFVTAITMIVDLVTLVNYFLNGEITTRFILKVIVVLVTAAAVFGYYLWDLRRDVTKKTKVNKVTAWSTSIVLVAAIVLGFVLVGSPMQQRLVRLDETRVSDLQLIQNEVVNFYATKHTLPASLRELSTSLNGFNAPVDPETSAAYEYIPAADAINEIRNFELCASFATTDIGTTLKSGVYPEPRSVYIDPVYGGNWSHTTGRVCFTRTVDSSMFYE
jgi:hypothetical protein